MYRGQWNPPVDEILHRVFFPDGTPPGVLVECGAADGLEDSCGKFFAERGWAAFNVEPDVERFLKLLANRPNDTNVNAALSDADGEITFRRGQREGDVGRSRCMTWASLVAELGLTKVDLFVLDVEGHELAVVAGMAGCPVLPKVICAEYPWPSTQYGPLVAALEKLGYQAHFVSWNNVFLSLEPRPPGPFFGETRVYQPGELD
jgi:FkbM family methyltransferase